MDSTLSQILARMNMLDSLVASLQTAVKELEQRNTELLQQAEEYRDEVLSTDAETTMLHVV